MAYKHHVQLPRSLDEVPYLLIFRLDDIGIWSMVVIIGFMLDQFSTAIVVGLVVAWGYRKLRLGRPEGYLVHELYWQGLSMTKARAFPNAFIRRLEP